MENQNVNNVNTDENNVNAEKKETTAYDVEMKKLEMEERRELENKEFKRKNKNKILGLLLAFLTIACLFDFGFFRTLGIWVVMLIGYGVGAWYDRDRNFLIFIRNMAKRLK